MNTSKQVPAVLRPALVLAAISLLVFGLLYPALGVGVAQVLFPHQARGSLIERGGVTVGSDLVGQAFVGHAYLIGRPSAAGYDPRALAGSNWSPSHPDLAARIRQNAAVYATREGIAPQAVPADAVTASGSGIDPHISPENARLQAARIALARGVAVDLVQALIADYTQGASLGMLGQPRVNVLAVNLALDAQLPQK